MRQFNAGEGVEIMVSGEIGVIQRVMYEVIYADANGCARVEYWPAAALKPFDVPEAISNVVALRAKEAA